MEKIKVFYNNQNQLFQKREDFNTFKKDCFYKFAINNRENIIFYIKRNDFEIDNQIENRDMIVNDLIIKIDNQKDYKDMILDEINTPNIYISIKELFLVKEQINKVKEEINKIQNKIEKNKQIIKNSKENIVKITESFEQFKNKVNEEMEKLKNEFSKDLMSMSSSLISSKNHFLSSLHKINLSITNLNIPEINKNKIEEYYIAKIKLKNNGPIPIPAKTNVSLNNNYAFRIIDKYINDGKEIQKDETVDINIKLSLINKDLLKEGFNSIDMRLYSEEFADFGGVFQIKVAYS